MANNFVRNIFGLTPCLAVIALAQTKQILPTYFPPKLFADLKRSRYLDGKLEENWFGAELRSMHEPSLYLRTAKEDPAFRLLLLPSFNHAVVVRIYLHSDGTGTVNTSVGAGNGGYAPKGILSQHERQLDISECNALKAAISQARFWALETEPNGQTGTDGTEWVFEASEHGQYHAVDRWEGGELRNLGLYMLGKVGQVGSEANLKQSIE